MAKGRTIIRYVGGVKDGREKHVMAAGLDSRQEYKSAYFVIEKGEEVEKKVVSLSWDYDLPPNWIRCTYDQYEKRQDLDTGVIMQYVGSVERKRCIGITTKKLRCSRPVKGDTDFCHQHS